MALADANLRQLRTFLAVAHSGSFTKGAERVRLTQSAVSRQMKDLEHSVGARLFERFGRAAQLTNAGKALLPQVEKILFQAEDAGRLIQELNDGTAGELTVGATITAANYLLPDILAAHRHEYPKVRLVLRPAASAKLLNQVYRNELDLALVGHVPAHPDLRIWGTIKDEIVMVSSPRHPLAGSRRVSAGKMADQDLILRESASDTRRIVEQWAVASGVQLQILMEMW